MIINESVVIQSNGICDYCKKSNTCEMRQNGKKDCSYFRGKAVKEVSYQDDQRTNTNELNYNETDYLESIRKDM